MKFIEVSKARNLEIDVPVFTIDKSGEYSYGKLIKIEKTKTGTEYLFLRVEFSANGEVGAFPCNTITHVCIPKK